MLPAELEILLTWRRRDEVVPDRNFVAKKLCELLHRSRNVMPRPLRIRMHYMYCTIHIDTYINFRCRYAFCTYKRNGTKRGAVLFFYSTTLLLLILTLIFVRCVHEWGGAKTSDWNTNIKKSQMDASAFVDSSIDWLSFQET